MFPLVDHLGFGTPTDYVLAFALGIGFGFFLERAGFGNANKLAMQFYFRDMAVLKVMFTAIVTAMTGLVVLTSSGALDASLVYINPTYLWPGVVGGLIMGAGFIIGGYCPGTALVGVVTGKVDALLSVLGGMLGMALFAESFGIAAVARFYDLDTAGITGRITLPDWLGVRPGLVALVILVVAVAGFVAAEWAERRFNPVEA
jgi:hypothetical protein